MSLEELAFPVIHQLDSTTRNGHAAAREHLRGPLWPAVEMWTDAAPKRLRNKSACKTPLKSWARWLEYLSKRKQPRWLIRLLKAKSSSLTWGFPLEVPELLTTWQEKLEEAVKATTKAAKKVTDLKNSKQPAAQVRQPESTSVSELRELIVNWQESSRIADGSAEILWAYQAVAIARAMPELARILPAEDWWQLLDGLAVTARDASSLSVVEHPLPAQVLAAELSLTLAYQFPEFVNCAELFAPGRQALAAGLRELLDGEGVVQQSNWSIQRLLLASWTRCRALESGLPKKVFDSETERQYTLAIAELRRATRADGRQVLGSITTADHEARDFKELDAAASHFVPDLRNKKAAAKFRRQHSAEAAAKSAESVAGVTPEASEKPRAYDNPSVNSEWAQVTIFRRGWKPREPLLACSYDKDDVRIEVGAERQTVLSGRWHGLLFVNDQRLAAVTAWREVCQISDDDADYLELELQLEQGYKIQRQICLGRKERFVYLCDSILGHETNRLNYMQAIGVGSGITASPDAEMREITLGGNSPLARIIPLGLPEWRSERNQGEFGFEGSTISLMNFGRGRNLCAPLWIDLDPKRHSAPLTWRSLTVAENRVICSPDVARGWRVQIAERQWLVYRALAGKGNRTILGHNLISEFLLAQFKNGETSNLVEVE